MASSHDRDIFIASAIPPVLIVGWTWLLHFPWDWVLYSITAVEFLIFLFIWNLEIQASKVSGASGWMLFISFFFQLFIVVGITVSRIVILLGQVFF